MQNSPSSQANTLFTRAKSEWSWTGPSLGINNKRVRLRPENITELRNAFAGAARIDHVDVGRMDRVLEYAPEDMTVTAEAGITFGKLQSVLRQNRQWLPLDPPCADDRSLEHLLAWNLSGPRRFGFGTARDHVIGARIVLGSGELIKAGGKVVKNVAGYDLCKLFVGARQTLGIIVEVSFKLRPLPERETFIQATFSRLAEVEPLLENILKSELTPHVLDLHHLSGGVVSLVLGFSGSAPEVEAQVAMAGQLGSFVPATLEYDESFWATPGADQIGHISVLPSKLFDTIGKLESAPWVARAGNGVVYAKSYDSPPREMPAKLMRRLKAAYDPKGILPEFV